MIALRDCRRMPSASAKTAASRNENTNTLSVVSVPDRKSQRASARTSTCVFASRYGLHSAAVVMPREISFGEIAYFSSTLDAQGCLILFQLGVEGGNEVGIFGSESKAGIIDGGLAVNDRLLEG